MSEIPNIDELWSDWRQDIYPAGVSQTQLIECRRAFYAGAGAVISVLAILEDDSVSEDEAIAILKDTKSAVERFFNEVVGSKEERHVI